jgi:predicted HTH transcriptional regulator
MTKSKTLGEKAQQKLKTLTDDAITVIRRENVSAFTKGWLGQQLSITKPMVSKVISQLKKDEFLKNQTANSGDFQDPMNRGKYSLVREIVGGKWVSGKGRYDT